MDSEHQYCNRVGSTSFIIPVIYFNQLAANLSTSVFLVGNAQNQIIICHNSYPKKEKRKDS